MESFGIILGNFETLATTIQQGNNTVKYKTLGVGIIAGGRDGNVKLVTINDKFLHPYFAALLFNFDCFSYSDQDYSAGDANAFVYPNVVSFYGNKLMEGKMVVQESATRYITETDTNKIVLTDKSGSLEKK